MVCGGRFRGCNPQDRVIPFLDSPPHYFARPEVAVKFHSHPKPDMCTLLSIWNIARNDPESETYSVWENNCKSRRPPLLREHR